jgi:DNA polymerase-4
VSAARKIIHVDMDAFFASVEIRDCPALADQCVAVGGAPERRGVIATCNYAARAQGIHAAMSSKRAMTLCPDLQIIPTNMPKYKAASQAIHQIFQRYSPMVEAVGLDEAYLDVTEATACQGVAAEIAQEICQAILEEVGLAASAGVSVNKMLAKMASARNKPKGLCVIKPHQIQDFMRRLPVAQLPGVGPVRQRELSAMGIETCGDLQRFSRAVLLTQWGRFGETLYAYARGMDDRPVLADRVRRAVSIETTFAHDIGSISELQPLMAKLRTGLMARIETLGVEEAIRGVFVKVKFSDFKQTTAECSTAYLAPSVIDALMKRARERHTQGVRLLGLGVRLGSAQHAACQQMNFDFMAE